jgi:hypothetical protein
MRLRLTYANVMATMAVVGILAIACGGCGGTSSPGNEGDGSITKAEFIEKADEVCSNFNAKYDANELEEANALPELEVALANALPAFDGSVEQLNQIPVPADDPAGAEAYVEKAEEALSLFRQLQRAVKNRDTHAIETYSGTFTKITGEERRVTSAYGFRVCGRTE